MHGLPMKRTPTLLSLALIALASFGASAHAQSKRDFSTVRYRPAVGPGNYFALEGADLPQHGQASYALAFDYATDTLVVEHPCRALANLTRPCPDQARPFVERTGLAHVLASVGIGGRTQLSFALPLGGSDTKPFSYWTGTPSVYHELRPKNGFVLGDLRVAAKVGLYRGELLRVAVSAFSTAPTAMLTSRGNCTSGEHCTFMGERGVQAGGYAIVELAPSARFRAAFNLGALYRPSRNWLGSEVGSELSYGAAASLTLVDSLALRAELQGALELAGADDVPLEARGGLAYGRDLVLLAGAGAGIVGDVGSPGYRVFAGLQWTPTYRDADGDGIEDDDDACPKQREDRDGFRDGDGCPELDNDEDGVPDALDQCDEQPEDRDGFRDEDGCPELDNDEDGVPDGYDTCEGQKEDHDGDHDDDGCPDLDTDRDGVLDEQDRCPNESEDTDGLGDDDGCPEQDFDQDGFLDEQDACPDQPGPNTGAPGDDGCPA